MKTGYQKLNPAIAMAISLLITGLSLIYTQGLPAADNQQHQHGTDHSHHKNMLINKGKYTVHRQKYTLPDIQLTSTNGKTLDLENILHHDGAVMINFIFTSCTTICPSMSVIFSSVHSKLASSKPAVKMISISIDPEYDTPSVLRKYAASFTADNNWLFYTGKLADIIEIQKSFDVYRGNKMNHFPATLIRARQNSDWIRIEGFASASDLVSEYRMALSSK